jgi:hypothetical protein
VKERIQTLQFISAQLPDSALSQLQTYFTQRAYQPVTTQSEPGYLVLEGIVRPSWFMAVFLSVLAAIGLLCLSLVVSLILPALGKLALLPALLSPLAGIFYWKRAKRPEQISLKVVPKDLGSVVTVEGHRDELQVLRQTLSITPLDATATESL